MNENKGNIEIDLKRLLLTLARHIWVILLVGIVLAALLFSYAAFMITPMYSASVQLYVNNTYGINSPGFSSSQLQAAQSLASTYMVFLESRDVLEAVAQEAGLGYTAGQINGMISSSAVNETEVFRVVVTCANYKHAAVIANAVAEVLPGKISAFVEGSSVVVVEHAVENPNPVSPNTQRYAAIGFLVGCVITALIVVVLDLTDTSITSEEYLAAKYEDLPLLAVIPDAESPKSGSHYKGYYKGSYESQSKKPPMASNGGAK